MLLKKFRRNRGLQSNTIMGWVSEVHWCSVVPFVPLDDQPGADLGPLVFPEATHLVYILMQSGVGDGATSVPPQPYCTEYGSYCATKMDLVANTSE